MANWIARWGVAPRQRAPILQIRKPFPMTLRIFAEAQDRRAVISLHGWLSVAEVSELERVAAEAQSPVTIDLAQLVGVDADGLQALRRQQERGARLVGASPFVELLLKQAAGRGDMGHGGTR